MNRRKADTESMRRDRRTRDSREKQHKKQLMKER